MKRVVLSYCPFCYHKIFPNLYTVPSLSIKNHSSCLHLTAYVWQISLHSYV